ncbi:MAG: hypothetical protein K2I39_01370 [Muribaculaceae bacterium]|nr:hypothetical protein [Muribaculaceae bacterium]
MASCNTAGCLDNQSAIPLAGFRSSATGDDISVQGIRISGVGAPADSAIASGSVSQVYLPMRSTAESTAWCFHYTQEGLDDPALNDTVTFGYESIPYFASEECGAMYRYMIQSVSTTTHIIDSVVVADSLITNVEATRIYIYFRTAETEEPEQ